MHVDASAALDHWQLLVFAVTRKGNILLVLASVFEVAHLEVREFLLGLDELVLLLSWVADFRDLRVEIVLVCQIVAVLRVLRQRVREVVRSPH